MAKVAAHDIDFRRIDEVLANTPEFFLNLPDRSADHLMIGPDFQGRFYFVPIVPWTDDDGWYPVTAYRVDEKRARRYYSGAGGA